jgi:hypothetical protein
VRYLARDAGIRQDLDIGTGIPSAGNVHEVAQEIAPSSRVLYVDNDFDPAAMAALAAASEQDPAASMPTAGSPASPSPGAGGARRVAP